MSANPFKHAPGSAHLNFGLAILTGVGGIFGYYRAASLPSLIAGLSFSGLYASSAYLITINQSERGHFIAAITSGILLVTMGRRFINSKKFMPAGMMTGAGVVGTAYNLHKYKEWTR